MFQSIEAAAPTRLVYSPRTSNKKVKIKVNKITEGSTVVMCYNSQDGAVLAQKNGNKKFNPSGGGIGICALLKPESTLVSKGLYAVKIGANTSNNPKENNYAASLTINFTDTVPIGAEPPQSFPSSTGWGMLWVGYIWNTGFFLDLKQMSGGAQYCHIQVDLDPTNPNVALIEGNLFVHLATSSNKNSAPQVIYNKELVGQPSQKNGSDPENVQNRNVFIDLSTEDHVFLIPLVGYSGTNPYTFSIGDPKDDADIQIDEV